MLVGHMCYECVPQIISSTEAMQQGWDSKNMCPKIYKGYESILNCICELFLDLERSWAEAAYVLGLCVTCVSPEEFLVLRQYDRVGIYEK